MSSKSVLQKCQVRVSIENVLQERQIRSVKEEVSSKSVK